jgi:predicted peptidase
MPQTPHHFEKQIAKTVQLDYLLYLPAGAERPGLSKWPAILCLHGAGERGSDLSLVKKHGIAKLLDSRPDWPFITITPQCPADETWDMHVDGLMALLDEIAGAFPVDRDRVYLTGLSMGGYGAWYLACLYPERFAAIAPICGGAVPMRGFPQRVAALRQVPVWAFHGALDPVVPLSESRALVNALKAQGGDVRLTVYPDCAHDSWTRTYANPELYAWFLSHSRASGSGAGGGRRGSA